MKLTHAEASLSCTGMAASLRWGPWDRRVGMAFSAVDHGDCVRRTHALALCAYVVRFVKRRRREERTLAQRTDRGLSLERVLHEAIRLARAEGIEAVTMRRLGRELIAGAMSLY